jgi:Alginate lyase
MAAAFVAAVAVLVALAACSRTDEGHPEPETTGMLAGWELTLPVSGDKGGAQIVTPAAVSPPWLTADSTGALVFWAPVRGVTTKNSEHARTELDRMDTFKAGSGAATLAATVTVAQVPTAVPSVIIGQIHGAGDISSVPFVLLYYDGGTVKAVVKQERTGEAHTDVPLLTGVGLGTSFEYAIIDGGDGSIIVSATANGHTATGNAAVPAAFSGATVRFQAGAYQQAPSSETAPADEGARVTFTAITVGPKAAPPA